MIPSHDPARYPLATTVSEACKRHPPQATRLLALAAREARRRTDEHGIPGL